MFLSRVELDKLHPEAVHRVETHTRLTHCYCDAATAGRFAFLRCESGGESAGGKSSLCLASKCIISGGCSWGKLGINCICCDRFVQKDTCFINVLPRVVVSAQNDTVSLPIISEHSATDPLSLFRLSNRVQFSVCCIQVAQHFLAKISEWVQTGSGE